MALAQDLPAVWHDPRPDMREKKQFVRILIKEIMVDLPPDEPVVDLVIHWAGGTHTQLRVRRYRTGEHRYVTDKEVTDLVRALVQVVPDRAIAAILNRLTLRTGHDDTWTQTRVRSCRAAHRIPVFDASTPREWLMLEGAAARLQVAAMTVHRFITTGLSSTRQVVAHAPWMIAPGDLERPAVRAAVQDVHQHRRRPPPRQEPRIIKAPRLTSDGRCTMVSSGCWTLTSRRELTRWGGEDKFSASGLGLARETPNRFSWGESLGTSHSGHARAQI